MKGMYVLEGTMRTILSIGIATYFAPDDSLEEKVSEEMLQAQKRICLQAYKFASSAIKNALVEWLNSGRQLHILLDLKETEKSQRAWDRFQKSKSWKRFQKSQEEKDIWPNALQASLIQELKNAGADIRCVPKEYIEKSHNKITIIDEKTVLTGSFNYKSHSSKSPRKGKQVDTSKSQSKKRQTDNLVILEHAVVAKNYQEMFNSYFDNSPAGYP
jgi:phosphatidylserine/phosphatidylglycerophosphate/cardiolipin synthase-like enzyme